MQVKSSVCAGGFVPVPFTQEPGENVAKGLGIGFGGPTMAMGIAWGGPTMIMGYLAGSDYGVYGLHVGRD